MYRVLYRKWRPENFCDVIGQEHVTTTLRNEIRSGRISHAYLFTGSRGTGKTSCAKILARAVNCLDPIDGEPCGKCRNCVGIANGSIMDVVEMDAASNNSVNDIRTMIDEVAFTPSDAKYRVYIIDEVHMLTSGAYNALLKTLEEPPAHIVFILATTEINKIPATILSRCQRFDFSRIDAHTMASRLIGVANEEKVTLADDAALLIATVADGAMRDALSILDRCIGLSGDITAQTVREATGLAGRDYLFTLADCIIEGNVPTAINTVDALHKASKSMSLLCEELSSHFRALMLLKTMKQAARGLIIMTDEEIEKAAAQAEKCDLARIISCIETLQSSRELMFRGGNNKIEFETCMIKLCSPRLSTDPTALVARLERLERTAKLGAAQTVQTSGNNTLANLPTNNHTDISANSSTNQYQPTASANLPTNSPINPQGYTPLTPPAYRQRQNTSVNPPINAPAPPPTQPPQQLNTQQAAAPVPRPSANASANDQIAALSARAVPFEHWEDVLEELKSITRVTATAFRGTTAYVVDDYILIDVPNETVLGHMRNPTVRDKIMTAIYKVTTQKYYLGPYRPPQSAPVQPEEEKPKSKLDEFIENISGSDIDVSVTGI